VELLLLILLTCVIATSASSSQVGNYGPAEQKFLEGGVADASATKIESLLVSVCLFVFSASQSSSLSCCFFRLPLFTDRHLGCIFAS
jgi:hypothetical protein